jgi:hypothetical protein
VGSVSPRSLAYVVSTVQHYGSTLKRNAFVGPRCLSVADPLSRVDFGSQECQKVFFRKARDQIGSWRILYAQVLRTKHVSLTLRKLKRWNLGQALPTAETVAAICEITGQEFRNLDVKLKDHNWGQKRGGYHKVATYGCNLTLQDRMIGGKLTGRSNTLNHLKTIASIGGSHAVKRMKNPNRRIFGPSGVRMFNQLERDTMNELVLQHLEVEYEPVIRLGSRRLIPDFRVGSTYIECTTNRKANVKGPELRRRFHLLKEHVQFRRGIVVTLPSLASKYKHYLGPDTKVVTVDDLRHMVYN